MIRGLSEAHLGLLRDAAGYRRLFLATLASSVGTWLAFVALVIDVYDQTDGNANWISALLIADFLPIVVIGLFFGPLVDRFPRRAILVASDLLRAAVFCALPFTTSALQVVLLALVVGVATSLFRPAVFAGLPNLVTDRDLPQANGLIQSAENVAWALGSLAGGALVAASGPDGAYWFNAATFVVSALLILRIRESFEAERAPRRGHWRDLREGFALVTSSRALITIVVAWSIVTVGQAIGNVAEIALAKEVFDAGDFGYGVLVATAAVGLFLGSFTGGGLVDRFGMRPLYVAGIALIAFGFGAAAASPTIWLAAVFVVVSGFGNGAVVVCNAVLVQRAAPDRIRGRAFTLVMSVGYAFFGLGMVGAGPLTNAFGARAAWSVSAGLCAVAALVGFALLAPGQEGPAGLAEGAGAEREPVRET